MVAPFAGVWIEISLKKRKIRLNRVAPFAGVWIEIVCLYWTSDDQGTSHPSRVCGLKFASGIKGSMAVAPFAGVWIEIP